MGTSIELPFKTYVFFFIATFDTGGSFSLPFGQFLAQLKFVPSG